MGHADMAGKSGRDLTEGPVWKHLVRMVAPMTVGISASFLVMLIDAYWLGQLGENALAAVGVAFPITFAVFAVAIGLSSGAMAAVARAIGAKDREEVRKITTAATLLAVLSCGVVSVLGAVFSPQLAAMANAQGELLELATVYLRIWFIGLVFLAGPVIANGILRAMGNVVTPSILMISTAFINMVLDPLLIFGVGPFPRMEMAGAAVATVLANVVAAVLFAAIMAFRERLLTWTGLGWSNLKKHWAAIARVGAPAAISTGANPIALFFVVKSLARFGDGENNAALAAFTAASRVETLAVIPLFALSGCIGPLTGQNFGAGRIDRVHAAFRASFLFCIIWSLATAVILAVFGGYLTNAMLPIGDPRDQ